MKVFLGVFLVLAAVAQAKPPEADGKNRMVFPPGAKEPVTSASPSPSPAAHGKDKPGETIDLFFLALKANQIDAAYDALVQDTVIADRKEDVANLKTKTKQAVDNYGPINGYEVIDEQTVGTVLFRRTCISFNTDLPLRWRFYFYKSDGVWRLVDLRVDDGLVELFDDAAKAHK